MDIGKTIRMARVAKKITQRQLVEKTGISLPTIVNIEHGKDASIRVLKKLCEALDLEIIINFKE